MIYGYIRVSSDKQTVENQRFEINNFCSRESMTIDGWIEETISGIKNYDKRDVGKLLTKVTIRNLKNKAQMTYTIVTETEANLREGKISVTTPIAKGLLGHKVGETVEVQAPAGLMKFEILKIEVESYNYGNHFQQNRCWRNSQL